MKLEVPEELASHFAAVIDRYEALHTSDDAAIHARMFPALSDDPLEAFTLEASSTDLRGMAAADAAATARDALDLAEGTLDLDAASYDAWVKVASNVRRIAIETEQADETDAVAEVLFSLLMQLRPHIAVA